MPRLAPAVLVLSVLFRSTCDGSPAPSKPPSTAPFEVVDLVDFGRHSVRNFELGKPTRELFVSFSDRWLRERDALHQWSVAGPPVLVATYPIDDGWFVFNVYVSPDGRRVLVRTEAHDQSLPMERRARYLLVDTVKRAVVTPDLRVSETGRPDIQWSASGQRFRITLTPNSFDGSPRELVYNIDGTSAEYDRDGRSDAVNRWESPAAKKSRVWVVESTKSTYARRGLYYTGIDGQDYRIEPDHWHGNYDITSDGRYVVTTTWRGDLLAWSTAAKSVVFTEKIASQYGYLAYDEQADRFLIGDATHDGTTKLRALVRRGTR